MGDTEHFALLVLLGSAVGIVAVLSSRLTERLKVPSPALVLAGAAVAAKFAPGVRTPSQATVVRVVTVALVCVLFDGGMKIGAARARAVARPILVVGVAGTVLSAAAVAVLGHLALGFGWYASLLVATAVAPTDPAVVFSVLARRQVTGRAGTILEGESGANDPVGIALMASLVAAGGIGAGALWHVAAAFLLEMGVGAAVGLAGGRAITWFARRVPLPGEGLYPVRTLASAMALYAVASVAHGSGFLAVFLAGIALGDERVPYGREIEGFHSALASLGEIVAFVVLGLTVDVSVVVRPDVLLPGLAIGAALALVVRPALVGPLLARSGLAANERAFVLFAGLKGAVPILLGGYLFEAHLASAERLYSIVVVVVVLSVVVQGSLVPAAARLLEVPLRVVAPEPWTIGVRLRDEPVSVERLTVEQGSRADGCSIGDLGELLDGAWIALVVRDGRIRPARGATVLAAGDEVTVLDARDGRERLEDLFGRAPGR